MKRFSTEPKNIASQPVLPAPDPKLASTSRSPSPIMAGAITLNTAGLNILRALPEGKILDRWKDDVRF